jgi:hypothetical protein
MKRSEKPEIYATNHSDELIVKGPNKKAVLYAILMTIPCIGLLAGPISEWIISIKEHFITVPLLLMVFYGIAAFFWFKVFDRKIKLIINQNGLWTKSTGFVYWESVWYYYLRERRTFKAGTFYDLFFKLRDDEKDYKLEITFLNTDYNKIRRAIKLNARNYNVHELNIDSNK